MQRHILLSLRKYRDFGARASRTEFWTFLLFVACSAVVGTALDGSLGTGPQAGVAWSLVNVALAPCLGLEAFVAAIVMGVVEHGSGDSGGFGLIGGATQAVLMVPGLAVLVRRLHDADNPGGWAALVLVPVIGPIALLGMCAGKGTVGANRFGPPPGGGAPSSVADGGMGG